MSDEDTFTFWNPYIDDELVTAQEQYGPSNNRKFEKKHGICKTKKKKKKDKNVWFASDTDEDEDEDEEEDDDDAGSEQEAEGVNDRLLRGNEENTEKLVTKYVRDHEDELELNIPRCINTLCFEFSYEPTNILFSDWDDRINHYVSVSEEGKMVKISSRTAFIFSEDGYNSGHHIWHIKCHRVYNCQALGIVERKNVKYRYGDNIFDENLNSQLGDRYIYAGDNGHSWRGSNELRPYVCSWIDDEEYYTKKLDLKNGRWRVGDIITVQLHLGSGRKDDDSKRTIQFFKNGKALHESIRVVKKCMYWPVLQCYQRGEFEIIDDITKEPIYQPETDKNEEEEASD